MSDKPTLILRDGKWVPEDLPEMPGAETKPALMLQDDKWVPEEVDFDFMTMVKNFPGSAGELATETWEGIKSLPEVASAVADNPAVLKDIPGVVWDDLVDSYGGVERFQRTLMEDPARVATDVVGIIGGLGSLLKTGGKVARKFGEELYTGTSKFSPTLSIEEKKALNRSAIQRGIGTTEGGAAKMSSRINALNKKMDDLITGADPGDIIPVDRVMRLLKETRHDLGGMRNVDAAKDLATIDRIEEAFREYAWNLGRDNFTVAELQDFKKNIYKTIKFDARNQKGTMAEEKARKAIGKGAKEEIERVVPDVADVNRELSDLYELQPHVERAASRIANRNMISLPGMIGGGLAGGFAGGSGASGGLGALAGALAMSAILNPTVGQFAGRGLYKAGDMLDRIPAGTAAGIPFIMPGRLDDEDDE